jgi:hypothetical protein
MAPLRRFPDSKYWFAHFIGPNGKQRTCSTKELDKRCAQKIADRFELAAHMARIGGLAARQARKVIGEIYEISNRGPCPVTPLPITSLAGPKRSPSRTATRPQSSTAASLKPFWSGWESEAGSAS